MSASEPFRRRVTAVLGALLATLLSGTAAAQPIVTDEDIARARRDTPTVTDDDIRGAKEKHAASTPGSAPTVPPGPRIEALPQPLTRVPADLSAIAEGYAGDTARLDGAQALATGPALLVFVSLAMPEATLTRLVDQAARTRATLLIRGFVNGSLRETVARVQRLIGGRQVAVQIDPQAFDRFAVTRVPSFVLVRDGTRPAACATGACPPAGEFVRTAGDVSLDYALKHLRRAAPGFQPEADRFLARLKPQGAR